MYFFDRFPSVIVASAIVIVQPQVVLALEATDIYKIAEKVTVLIDGQNPGSGVIISKEGNTYYVLTAAHVVETPDEYQIIAPDKEKYTLDYSKVKKLANVDLAVVQFTSDRAYETAQLGDSDDALPGANVHIFGFPNPGREIKERIAQFTSGQITANSELKDGYALVYTNVTRAGMSGGPVLNDDGLVVGIHGRAEAEAEAYSQGNESGSSTDAKIGFNLGVPINKFFSLAPEAGLDLALERGTETATPAPVEEQPAVETPSSSPPTTVQTQPTTPPSSTGIPSRPQVIGPANTSPGGTICAGRTCE